MSPLPRNATPYDDVLGTIGSTPLIRLNRVTRGIATPVYGKADFFNPGGSVKDRIGLPIIEQAEREGRLGPRLQEQHQTERDQCCRDRVGDGQRQ